MLRERKMLLLLACLLLLITAGVFLYASVETKPAIRLGVADEDDSEYSRLLLSYFEDNENFGSYISIIRGKRPELESKFDAGELDVYLVIPEDFAERLINIDNVPIEAVVSTEDLTKSVLLKNVLEAYAGYISAVEVHCQALYDVMADEGYDREKITEVNTAISYDLIFTALGKDDLFKRIETERFHSIPLTNYYIYSAIVLLILYAGLLAGLNYLNERRSRIYERLISAGVPRFRIWGGKLAAFSAVYSVAAVAGYVIMTVAGSMEFSGLCILVIILGLTFACILFFVLASFFKTAGAYITAANMLILLSTVAGGGIIPIMYLPRALTSIARFTPNYWFIQFMLEHV